MQGWEIAVLIHEMVSGAVRSMTQVNALREFVKARGSELTDIEQATLRTLYSEMRRVQRAGNQLIEEFKEGDPDFGINLQALVDSKGDLEAAQRAIEEPV